MITIRDCEMRQGQFPFLGLKPWPLANSTDTSLLANTGRGQS